METLELAPAARDPFEVDLERFHGPLDLLLHLIRNQDIDIFDIPIARITAQFLAAIRDMGRLYKNPFGLDPKIVNKTLEEAVQCRR